MMNDERAMTTVSRFKHGGGAVALVAIIPAGRVVADAARELLSPGSTSLPC